MDRIASIGSPTNLNRVISFDTVQEPAATNWVRLDYPPLMQSWLSTPAQASIYCRFTDFSVLGGAGTMQLCDQGGSNTIPVFQDCQFHGGSLYAWNIGVILTNCLLDRVDSYFWGTSPSPNFLRNCTFHGGHLDLYNGLTNSIARDNLFDQTSIYDESSVSYLGGFNGYVTNCTLLIITNNDVTLTSSPAYQSTALGNSYLPTNSPLLRVGSTNANYVGLYSYTTATNQTAQTNNYVDLGYHYVTLNASGYPVDTDGDGVPDFLQDVNGNGSNFGTPGMPQLTNQLASLILPGYLRCEYRENPWGVFATNSAGKQSPRLYWVVQSNRRAEKQRAYQIQVATSLSNLTNNTPDMWDTGKTASDQTTHVEYNGGALTSGLRLWWRVRSWEQYNDLPSPWSTNAFWQMGLLTNTDWKAQWLTTSTDPSSSVSPIYRTSFVCTNSIKQATAYVTARGVYEFWLNGNKIGVHILAPEWTDYNTRIQHQTYDVTTNLFSGSPTSTNIAGAIVAEGWFSGDIGNHAYSYSNGSKQFLLQLAIQFTDGTYTNIVTSGTNWSYSPNGPLQDTSIWVGETYNATLETAFSGWSAPDYAGLSNFTTSNLTALSLSTSLLVPQPNDSIQITELLSPVDLWTAPGGGAVIYDLGQNMVGWCQIQLSGGNSGDQVILQHSELLGLNPSNKLPTLHGDISFRSLGDNSTIQVETYTLKGSASEVFFPHFTYHGFRYVKVSGPSVVLSKLTLASLTGCVFRSSSPISGSFTCSNPLVSKIMTNILWTQKGNLMGVSTDCPQREERYGYLGDAQIFAQTACYNMDMASFYTKWLRDIRDDQELSGSARGRYPYFAPYTGRFYYPPWFDIGWQMAGIVLPWRLFQNYGDTRFLAEHFGSVTNWMNFLTNGSNPTGHFTISSDAGIGDWLSGDNYYDFGGTVPYGWYISGGATATANPYAMSLYAYSADVASNISLVLSNEAFVSDNLSLASYYGNFATQYSLIASNTRVAFTNDLADVWIHRSGNSITNIGFGSQSDAVAALFFNMLPINQTSNIQSVFLSGTNGIAHYNSGASSLDYQNSHLSTGIQFSGRAMLELTKEGRSDLAYQLLLDLRFPSWGYNATNGMTNVFQETTIAEHWNSYVSGANNGYLTGDNSFNHYALGAVGEWVYKVVGGISLDENSPGFQNVIISPQAGGNITNATASLIGIHGSISSSWTTNLTSTNYNLCVSVPANTTATVKLPSNNLAKILEGTSPAANSVGVLSFGVTNGITSFNVGSGTYTFLLSP